MSYRKASDGGPQYPVVIYRGGMECGSGKEAELPVLGDTGSHCHTVTVGTTHAVVVDSMMVVGWSIGSPRFAVDRGVGVVTVWPTAFRPSEPSILIDHYACQ